MPLRRKPFIYCHIDMNIPDTIHTYDSTCLIYSIIYCLTTYIVEWTDPLYCTKCTNVLSVYRCYISQTILSRGPVLMVKFQHIITIDLSYHIILYNCNVFSKLFPRYELIIMFYSLFANYRVIGLIIWIILWFLQYCLSTFESCLWHFVMTGSVIFEKWTQVTKVNWVFTFCLVRGK